MTAAKEVAISEIKIGKRHRKDLGDIDSLAASIGDIGLITPIAVTPDMSLVAGARRIAALKKLGRTNIAAFFVNSLDDAAKRLIAERDENTCRLELKPTEALSLQQALIPLERKVAEASQKSGKSADGAAGGRGNKKNHVGSSDMVKRDHSRDTVSRAAEPTGYSARSLKKVEEVQKAAESEPEKYSPLLDEMDATGKIDRAFKKFKSAQRAEEMAKAPTELPEGEYDVILADPPWRYDFSETENRQIENHYPTMAPDEIAALDIPAAKNCVLFMWATAPKLREAFDVLDGWGFEYKTHAVWDKKKIGMGYWFRGRHELLMVATRGTVNPPSEGSRQSSVFEAERGKHSAKPDYVYELIEKMFPNRRYLEMFARRGRQGWTAWGNQAPQPAAA